ncbi:hypothetical protein OG800_17680 [Streptomyces sp. NBC_00445]|uniref:hypothetical protein n=1 Tax=Streptomyces sp. NBC_00445 TaxID=2975745 RepID=UPI002E209210
MCRQSADVCLIKSPLLDPRHQRGKRVAPSKSARGSDLTGVTVTADALHGRRGHARYLVEDKKARITRCA